MGLSVQSAHSTRFDYFSQLTNLVISHFNSWLFMGIKAEIV